MSDSIASAEITLSGSASIVTQFFGDAVNSILFQRGIYPPEDFFRTQKYGLQIMDAKDPGLKRYLGAIMEQLHEWLEEGNLQKLVCVVSSVETGEPLERWVFDIKLDTPSGNEPLKSEKSLTEIHKEIQAIIRQITASVTFLPLLNELCSFDLLCYTDQGIKTPTAWEESDPRYIVDSSEVRLRSFTTRIHKVDTIVSYSNNNY